MSVLAFLFASQASGLVRRLDVSLDYFHLRSGDTWELFFPGYYGSVPYAAHLPPSAQGRRFRPEGFNALREYISTMSQGLWDYSGGIDLVLVPVSHRRGREPRIEWEATLSGRLAPDGEPAGGRLPLRDVVEAISDDLEYEPGRGSGVRRVVEPPGNYAKLLTVVFAAAAEILTALLGAQFP